MNAAAAMGLAVPESVTIAMAELAGDVQEGLLALAVGTGLAAGDGRDDERRCRGVVRAALRELQRRQTVELP